MIRRREFLAIAGLAPFASRGAASRGQAPAEAEFVIVGAGSAGCVLAHRLSANPSIRVAVIEAGASGEADPAVITPGRWPALIGSAYDWGFRTESSPGLGDRSVAFPRGKAHGGSSAIGALIFARGDRRCFDRWRDLGNPGWGYDDVLPLFKRLERNETGASDLRGGDGPLAVSGCYDPHSAHRAFLSASYSAGYKSDARFDFNGPLPQGVAGFLQKNLLDDKRHSAAAAFLVPALGRPNLALQSRTTVTKVVVERGRATGVEFVRGGQRQAIRASRAVILCGGVVNSPQLLMLSGIGPADHVRAVGLPVVADVPGIGRNLQDHLRLAVRWQGRTELPASTVTAGLFTHSNPLDAGRLPADLFLHLGRGVDTPERTLVFHVTLTRSVSRGEVRLRSADPLAPPVIQANYLQDDADVRALVRGIHLARFFAEQSVYGPLRGDELEPGAVATSDDDLARFVRRTADTDHGAAGTCRMGPAEDPAAVVDAALRVRGVDGLYVADASIMPEVVNTPPHAACVMIGERAADLLRRA